MKHARSPAIVSSSPILSLIFVFRRTSAKGNRKRRRREDTKVKKKNVLGDSEILIDREIT